MTFHELPQHILTFKDRREAERNDNGLRKDPLQNLVKRFYHFRHGCIRHLRGEIGYEAAQPAHIDPPNRRPFNSGTEAIDLRLLFRDAVGKHWYSN